MLERQCVGKVRCGRSSSGRAAALVVAAAVAVLVLAAPAFAGIGPTTRESLSNAGAQATGTSDGPSLSADGSLLAFRSNATDLVVGDTNAASDVFVRDRTNGTTTRVSVASNGAQAQSGGTSLAISGDGRYVAFVSSSPDIDPTATSGFQQVYVRDRIGGTTRRVSRTPTGGEPNAGSSGRVSLSRDGRYVAFISNATNLASDDPNPGGAPRVYVYDTKDDKTVRVSETSAGAPGAGLGPSVSGDGRYVAFLSPDALVPGDTNGVFDIYIRDRDADGNGVFDETGAGKTSTTLASVAPDGTTVGDGSSGSGFVGPTLSADGRQVAFPSNATNLVAGDTNAVGDVFVRDLRAGKTTRISVSSSGSEGDGISGSSSSLASPGLALSADGRRVAFSSNATNLVDGDTNGTFDVFVRDRDADGNGTFDEPGAGKETTTRESVSTTGVQGDFSSRAGVSLTEDGTGLAFASGASNLVDGDTNSAVDVFFRRLAIPPQMTLTVTKAGAGQGTVTSSPAGIDCGSTCSHAFTTGASVTLTAAPAAGSTFTGFSGGGCAGAATTCTVTLDAARSVTATFAAQQTLTVAKAGAGQGTVTSLPAGIDCGASCSHAFDAGASVTLTAVPAAGSTFSGFSGGGCAGAATTCTVTLDAARSVTATFAVAQTGGGGNPPGGGSAPPAGGGGVVSPGSGAVRDTLAPGVSRYGVARSPFAVGGGSTPTFGSAAKARMHKKGTTFKYTLSEAATVTITISQRRPGRRQGIRCVAPRKSLRKKAKCTTILRKGAFTRTSHQGQNSVAFSGRIGTKALSPGTYSAAITATDAAKNTSRPKTISFTIVRR